EQDGDGGQHLHDDVQVVGDDAGEGIHHARDNGGVDVGHLNGLTHLNEHVLQQVVVLLIEGDDAAAEDLLQRHLICLQGGVEVDRGVPQSRGLVSSLFRWDL